MLDTTRMLVVVAVPLTLVLGVDVVAHGAITPGGGFQGGVVLATALHLLYVGGHYQDFSRLRPLGLFEQAEAIGVFSYAVVGAVGLALGGAWLANVVPQGTLTQLVSAGTVVLLNGAVGLAVAGSVVVLLSHFLEQRFLSLPAPLQKHDDGESP
ncbi:MnhB domain-containing protein [Specibacter cremeus]|uniref:MnhB domain-containing protein n=1 Tax=Specibacter cremeus TaxID=1629051 RepID=UPI000F77698C|nr:MnhB domain-containing protein [Specibacter cremeus]